MPVFVGPGKSGQFDSQDDTDVVQADFGKQPLKPKTAFGCGAALTLVFVDDLNPVGRPAKLDGKINQGVLASRRFLMVRNLLRRGLSHVDNRRSLQMMRLKLRWISARKRIGAPFLYRLSTQSLDILITHAIPPFVPAEGFAWQSSAPESDRRPADRPPAADSTVDSAGPAERPLFTRLSTVFVFAHDSPPCVSTRRRLEHHLANSKSAGMPILTSSDEAG